VSPIKRCVFFVKTLVFVFDYGQVGFVRNVVAYVPIAPFKREWCRLVEVPAFHILTVPIAGTPISNSYFRGYLYRPLIPSKFATTNNFPHSRG